MTAKLIWTLAAALLAAGSAVAEPKWILAWSDEFDATGRPDPTRWTNATYAKEKDAKPDVWPFDQPHYLILNLAIGGAWGGQRGIDDAIFPQRFESDYVRVYQQVE